MEMLVLSVPILASHFIRTASAMSVSMSGCPSNVMTLYPPARMHTIAASDVLHSYSAWQRHHNSEPALCPLCTSNSHQQTQIICLTAPAILVLHIAAFLQVASAAFQAQRVEYQFDLQRSIELLLIGVRYRLSAFVLHIGTLQFGHYIACVRCGMQWWMCDDNSVKQITLDSAIPLGAIVYIAFYERQ